MWWGLTIIVQVVLLTWIGLWLALVIGSLFDR